MRLQEVFMALRIRAIPNNLKSGGKPYFAYASTSDLVESEEFIDRMAAGRTTLSKTDILAVFQLAREELSGLLAEGCYVKTPLGSAYPVARGAFESPFEPFRPGRRGTGHGLRFEFRLEAALEAEALAMLKWTREEPFDRLSPRPRSAEAIEEGASGAIRPGELLRIRGERLGFDPDNESLGVFFQGESGEETRSGLYAYVKPSHLIVLVPPGLEGGSCRLLVRTRSRGARILEGRLPQPLAVESPQATPATSD